MLKSKVLTGSLAVVVLCLAVGTAKAQTGPSGPLSGPGVAPSTPAPALQNQMTPQRLEEQLRKEGHQTQLKKFDNGGQMVVATVTRDNWRYVLEFEFTPDMKTLFVQCPLGNGTSYSAPQLLGLMQASFKIAPMHFSVRSGDNRLLLDGPVYSTALVNEQGVRTIVENYVRTARETHSLWGGAAVATNPLAAPKTPAIGAKGSVPATPTTNSKTPTATQNLANTTWVGTESLESYGKLEFRFQANGKVIMIDAAGQQEGSYTINGSNVTLSFHNNTVIYTGTLNGQAITGNVTNGVINWTFNVRV